VSTVASVFTARDLAFKAERHEYALPDGRSVPSVTQILSAVGVSTDFDGLAASSESLRERIEVRRDLGTAVHADIHAFDDGDLVWSTVDPRVKPFIEAWAAFIEAKCLRPIARERHVYHPIWNYCGTLDGVFVLPSGRKVLADAKIGDPADAACDLQTAGYQAAYALDAGDVDERWAVRLTPDLAVPFRITNYTARPDAWRDIQKFQACVVVYHEQAARRRSRR
jgi:hypothetical protein